MIPKFIILFPNTIYYRKNPQMLVIEMFPVQIIDLKSGYYLLIQNNLKSYTMVMELKMFFILWMQNQFVQMILDLGVNFNNNMKFHEQID